MQCAVRASSTPSATSASASSASTRRSLRLGRLPLSLVEPVDLNLQEFAERRLLLRRNRIELNRRAEHVLRRRASAPHLNDRAQHLTRDVKAAVAREDERR